MIALPNGFEAAPKAGPSARSARGGPRRGETSAVVPVVPRSLFLFDIGVQFLFVSFLSPPFLGDRSQKPEQGAR